MTLRPLSPSFDVHPHTADVHPHTADVHPHTANIVQVVTEIRGAYHLGLEVEFHITPDPCQASSSIRSGLGFRYTQQVASHLRPVAQIDLVRRYGYFL
jgi:hypothetical protein